MKTETGLHYQECNWVLDSILKDNNLTPPEKLSECQQRGYDVEEVLNRALDLHGITI